MCCSVFRHADEKENSSVSAAKNEILFSACQTPEIFIPVMQLMQDTLLVSVKCGLSAKQQFLLKPADCGRTASSAVDKDSRQRQ